MENDSFIYLFLVLRILTTKFFDTFLGIRFLIKHLKITLFLQYFKIQKVLFTLVLSVIYLINLQVESYGYISFVITHKNFVNIKFIEVYLKSNKI